MVIVIIYSGMEAMAVVYTVIIWTSRWYGLNLLFYSVSLLRCGSTSNQEGVCVRVFITQLHGCYVDN